MGPGGHERAFGLIRNPSISVADIGNGRELFQSRCATCHGPDGVGDRGPNLTTGHFRHGGTDWALFRTISKGVPGTAMPAFALPDAEIWQLIAFVQSLSGTLPNRTAGRASQLLDCEGCRAAQVPYERLLQADRQPANWLTYSGGYRSHRYVELAQIHAGNVKELKLRWAYQISTLERVLAAPLVVDGIMYLTQPPNEVIALATRTGDPLWS
ncbi:MAG: c-type cytochrome, partial [Burkholderiales bacterium]